MGTPKVDAMKRYLLQVCPNCAVFAINEMFTGEAASSLLGSFGKIDFMVDAIDDLPTKAALMKFCVDRNIAFISSMGAACKADPTRIHIGASEGRSFIYTIRVLTQCYHHPNRALFPFGSRTTHPRNLINLYDPQETLKARRRTLCARNLDGS